jgi:hypothetical protein
VREEMRNDHAPDRRRGVQDRGEAARDVRLAPPEEREGQSVVEQGKEQDRTPGRARQVEFLAPEMDIGPHRGSSDGQAQPNVGQRLYVANSDADEEEGPAPDQCEDAEDQPVASVHLRSDHVRVMRGDGRGGLRLLAVKRVGIDWFHGRTDVPVTALGPPTNGEPAAISWTYLVP